MRGECIWCITRGASRGRRCHAVEGASRDVLATRWRYENEVPGRSVKDT